LADLFRNIGEVTSHAERVTAMLAGAAALVAPTVLETPPLYV